MFCCVGREHTISAEGSSRSHDAHAKDLNDRLVEKILCAVGEIPEGGKSEFEVNGTKIVVIFDRGKYYGIGAYCPHLKGRLINGVYRNGFIRCPSHGAKYDVSTGDIEDFPTFNCLPTYKVFQRGNYVVVETRESSLHSLASTDWTAAIPSSSNSPLQQTIIVIGTGPAGLTFVETLRKLGCTKKIEMITQEFELPYDRTMLNKKYIANATEGRLHDEEWYSRMNVEVRTNTRVLYINPKNKTLVLSNSSCMYYSKLFIAMGCVPRKLSVPGGKLANICYLRTMQDSVHLWNRAKGANVVCIGGSFIGMEAASVLVGVAESVTVVCTTEEPLPAFGRDVGAALRKYFDRKGIRVITRGRIEYLSGSEMGAVEAVHLVDGEILPADCVVVGIGVHPDTDILQTSGFPVSNNGYLIVDEEMRVEENIWAGGDMTQFPLALWNIPDAHIEHFQVAQKHGQIAAYSLMEQKCTKDIIPFFWGRFFDALSLKFSGRSGFNEDYLGTLLHGDLANFEFTKYYFKDDFVIGVASAGPSNAAVDFIDLFARKIKVTRREVEQNITDHWIDWRSS
ncbi:unnamed protein product, partial [Mesorhabditis belari]|uniref:Rieske domain-containing protein n=1 Tax=Mesorhabditis belari TaxID=2138241 RepID=A0AAF3FS28_9BILA